MTPIHDRTPVIVQRVALRCWLAPEPLSEADYAAITSPFPSENLEAFPISPLVNNTRNEGPQLLERAAT
jgi:putative SOS response-associated peptidase YedK